MLIFTFELLIQQNQDMLVFGVWAPTSSLPTPPPPREVDAGEVEGLNRSATTLALAKMVVGFLLSTETNLGGCVASRIVESEAGHVSHSID